MKRHQCKTKGRGADVTEHHSNVAVECRRVRVGGESYARAVPAEHIDKHNLTSRPIPTHCGLDSGQIRLAFKDRNVTSIYFIKEHILEQEY